MWAGSAVRGLNFYDIILSAKLKRAYLHISSTEGCQRMTLYTLLFSEYPDNPNQYFQE